MLKGIDISSWQSGLDIQTVMSKNDLSFAFVKATEGLGLVDSWCDRFISELERCNYLWGFYHFARNNDPIKEANYFYQNTKNYFQHGIPVLDIEDGKIPDWSLYAQKFTDRIKQLTGVHPMIYVSAGACWRFADSDVFKNCALWVAGYPRPISYWSANVVSEFDYSIYPWAQASAWQFSGTGNIKGYTGNVDLDYAFMDKEAWAKIATGGNSKPKPQLDSYFVTACKVVAGVYGNGKARVEALEANGYDYDKVQEIVNDMISKYGS